MKEVINTKLSGIPDSPGVYLFKDNREKVLYVGKAKSLKKRIRSYFLSTKSLDVRKASMVNAAKDFSFVVTDNEVEALALEANFIKQYRPRFNVILRDDKNYPYLRITVNEEWPLIEVSRRFKDDGAVYIGPYVSARSMRETLDFINKNFPIRTCRYRLDKLTRPCIQYQIGNCGAPCVGLISSEGYMTAVNDAIEFLKGSKQNLLNRLIDKMHLLSGKLRFEEAARIRDRINAIRKAWEMQKVVDPEFGDMDVIGFYYKDSEGVFNIFFIRNGVLIGVKDFYVKDLKDLSYRELIYNFIEQFYNKEIQTPSEIIVGERPANSAILRKWLSKKRGNNVKIIVARGKEAEVLKMANENARTSFNLKKGKSELDIMNELAKRLKLKKIPESIGAFDISTISGSDSVGSFIYWKDGKFIKNYYRHLRIKTVKGIDDYSMMKEAVSRTVKNLGDNLPELVIIDGGKGHLATAIKALGDSGLQIGNSGIRSGTKDTKQRVLAISIAKKPDRIFLPDKNESINIEDGSKSSLILQRIRDEAHRFAINYHRGLRAKRTTISSLDKIKGVSKKRRVELLRHFDSVEAIRNATTGEIASIKGFSKKLAENILKELKNNSK